jgi:hypothetical protein
VSAEKAGKSVDELALDILQKKINAYERFNAQYPGYGGTPASETPFLSLCAYLLIIS